MSIFRSAVWDITGKIVNQVISFVVSVILARLLSPQEFGIMGISLAFVGFSTIFLDLGFKNAVIISRDNSRELFSSILWINLLIALLLSLVFYISAPLIAEFYKEKQVGPVIRWSVLMFIINALTLMPSAINVKALKFRELALISIISGFVSGAIAIWMALKGWGVWSILARSIINALLTCILNWIICKWVPLFLLSLKHIRSVWGYSSRMFTTLIIEVISQKMDVLIMARVYSTTTVGYYTRAQSLDNISRELISGSMYSVFFPHFGRIQQEPEKIKSLYLRTLHMISFLLIMLSGILFLNADDIFILLFTSKWKDSAPLFRYLTLAGFFQIITGLMSIVISGTGKSSEYLRSVLIIKAIFILALFIGFMGSLNQFLYCMLAAAMVGMLVMAYFVHKVTLLDVGYQIKLLATYILIGVIAVEITLLLPNFENMALLFRIVMTAMIYLALYLGINSLIKTKGFTISVEQARNQVLSRKK
jgi:teichuronic acid exporter